MKQKVDFRSVTLAHDAHLTQYHEEWSKRFEDDSDPKGDFTITFVRPSYKDSYCCRSEMCIPLYSASFVSFWSLFFSALDFLNNVYLALLVIRAW